VVTETPRSTGRARLRPLRAHQEILRAHGQSAPARRAQDDFPPRHQFWETAAARRPSQSIWCKVHVLRKCLFFPAFLKIKSISCRRITSRQSHRDHSSKESACARHPIICLPARLADLSGIDRHDFAAGGMLRPMFLPSLADFFSTVKLGRQSQWCAGVRCFASQGFLAVSRLEHRFFFDNSRIVGELGETPAKILNLCSPSFEIQPRKIIPVFPPSPGFRFRRGEKCRGRKIPRMTYFLLVAWVSA